MGSKIMEIKKLFGSSLKKRKINADRIWTHLFPGLKKNC